MKSLSFLFIAFFLLQLTTLAQAPTVEWSKVYDLSYHINGCSVHQTEEGNYIIGGEKNHPNLVYDEDCLIILADNNGDTILTRLYGEENIGERGVSFQPTFDDGYVMFGSKDYNLRLFKIDSNYEVQWEKEYISPVPSLQVLYSKWIEQTSDSGFIMLSKHKSTLSSNYYIYLIKTDSFGEVIWHKTFYWDDNNLEVYNVLQTNDSGFIVSGYTTIVGGYDTYLLKLNEYGDSLWTKFYTTSHYGLHVIQTSDDGFLLTGAKATPVGYLYLIKTDEQGEITWTKLFTGYSIGKRSIEYSDGGFITVGAMSDSDTVKNYLIKISDQGDSLWSVKWNINEIMYEYFPIDLKETADNGFIVLGYVSVVMLGPTGDLYLTKLTSGPNEIKDFSQNLVAEYSLIQNFPNPFNPLTTIKYQIPELSFVTLKIYDVLGNEIETLVNEEKPNGSYEVEFDAIALPSGVYFYQLKAGSFVETKKMVLMK